MSDPLSMTLQHPRRGPKGRFSNLEQLFRLAGEHTLKKFGLYNDQNASEVMAELFSTKNFGYGADAQQRALRKRPKRSPPASFGPPGTADAPAGIGSPSEGGRP